MSCNSNELSDLAKKVHNKQLKKGFNAGIIDPNSDCSNAIFFFDNSGVGPYPDISYCCDDISDNLFGFDLSYNLCCDLTDCSSLAYKDCVTCGPNFACNCLNSLAYNCLEKDVKCTHHPLPRGWIDCSGDCNENHKNRTRHKKQLINKQVSLDTYGRINRLRNNLNSGKNPSCALFKVNQNRVDDRIRRIIPAIDDSKCCDISGNNCNSEFSC